MPRKKEQSVANISPMRPMPRAILFDESNWTTHFVPADGLREWIETTFLAETSPLYNEDHRHLKEADLAFLWAGVENNRQMRRVVGQCEEVTFRAGAWQKGRQEQQMKEWFGHVPEYLITLDAHYAMQCSDIEFCALVEHELFHLAHKLDEFGQPAFDKGGRPKFAIRDHDVSEFVGVVKRYGVGNPEGALAQMVEAAKAGPTISKVSIARMCGTCLLRAA